MATPIYRKIKDLIMQEIEDKAANSPIDSERDMAVRFDASRMTVRKGCRRHCTDTGNRSG